MQQTANATGRSRFQASERDAPMKPSHRKAPNKEKQYSRMLCLGILLPFIVFLGASLPKDVATFKKQVMELMGQETPAVKLGKNGKPVPVPEYPSKMFQSYWHPNEAELMEYVNSVERTPRNAVLGLIYLEDCKFCHGLARQLNNYANVVADNKFDQQQATLSKKDRSKKGREAVDRRSSLQDKVLHHMMGDVSVVALDAAKMSPEFIKEHDISRYPMVKVWYHEVDESKTEEKAEKPTPEPYQTRLTSLGYSGPDLYRQAPIRLFNWFRSLDYEFMLTTMNPGRQALVMEAQKTFVTAHDEWEVKSKEVEAEIKKLTDEAAEKGAELEESQLPQVSEEEPEMAVIPINRPPLRETTSQQELLQSVEDSKLNYQGNARFVFSASPKLAEILIDMEDKGDLLSYEQSNPGQALMPPLHTTMFVDKSDEAEKKCAVQKEEKKAAEEKAAAEAEKPAEAVETKAAEIPEGAVAEEKKAEEGAETKAEDDSTLEEEVNKKLHEYDPCSELSLTVISASTDALNPHTSVRQFSFHTEEKAREYLGLGRLERIAGPAFGRLYLESLGDFMREYPLLIVANQNIKDPKVLTAFSSLQKTLDFMIAPVFVDPRDNPSLTKELFGYRHWSPSKGSKLQGPPLEFKLFSAQANKNRRKFEQEEMSMRKKGGKHKYFVHPKLTAFPDSLPRFTGDATDAYQWSQWIVQTLQNPKYFDGAVAEAIQDEELDQMDGDEDQTGAEGEGAAGLEGGPSGLGTEIDEALELVKEGKMTADELTDKLKDVLAARTAEAAEGGAEGEAGAEGAEGRIAAAGEKVAEILDQAGKEAVEEAKVAREGAQKLEKELADAEKQAEEVAQKVEEAKKEEPVPEGL